MLLILKNHILKLSSGLVRGKNPRILAGAIIYVADTMLASQFNWKTILSQKLVSEATKIPEYSIRDHYVNLLKGIFINKCD